jgi:hypothetical protein
MQRARFSPSPPGVAKPGRTRSQAPLASAAPIVTPLAAAVPMNRRMTLLERFIADSVNSLLLALVFDKFTSLSDDVPQWLAQYPRARLDIQLSMLWNVSPPGQHQGEDGFFLGLTA